jgi:hypothetical protein
VAKPKKPGEWSKALERARRALKANKARLDASSSTGLASDKTLRVRSYDPDPSGGGPKVPRQVASAAGKRRKRKRRR